MFLKADTVWNFLKECAHSSPSPALSKNLGSTSHMRGSMSGSTDEDMHTFPVLVGHTAPGEQGGMRMMVPCRWGRTFCGDVALLCHRADQPSGDRTEKNQALCQMIIPDSRSRTTWLCKQTYLSETLSFLPESSSISHLWNGHSSCLRGSPGQCSVNGHPPQMTGVYPGQELLCAPGLRHIHFSSVLFAFPKMYLSLSLSGKQPWHTKAA